MFIIFRLLGQGTISTLRTRLLLIDLQKNLALYDSCHGNRT